MAASLLRARIVAVFWILAKSCSGFPFPPENVAPFDVQLLRPRFLVETMSAGPLQRKLSQCLDRTLPDVAPESPFVVAHRGGSMFYPEHTLESFLASGRGGAAMMECDVTFTRDLQLVCRHDQCDLHLTTNILLIPGLASKCSVPFQPADYGTNVEVNNSKLRGIPMRPASARCCTSDISLDEFRSLCGKMESGNEKALTPEEYVLGGSPRWDGSCGRVMTHKESIQLFKAMHVRNAPELKASCYFDAARNHGSRNCGNALSAGWSRKDFINLAVREYVDAGIPPEDVYFQSFDLDDIHYLIANFPDFGNHSIFLDDPVSALSGTGRDDDETCGKQADQLSHQKTFDSSIEKMQLLANMGIRFLAAPIRALLSHDASGRLLPSNYAVNAQAAGLKLIVWTFEERNPWGVDPRDWFEGCVGQRRHHTYDILHSLVSKVKVEGVFSDWAPTITFYLQCMSAS